jgi:outer membrane murein-binding lipoprotein Lpp
MLERGDLFIIRRVLLDWLAEHPNDLNAANVQEVLEKAMDADRELALAGSELANAGQRIDAYDQRIDAYIDSLK